MSTAGKVLVVLIMLASLVWMLLTAGVDQLNRNGNQALIALTEKVDKLQADLKNTQDAIVRGKDQTTCCKSRWIESSRSSTPARMTFSAGFERFREPFAGPL